MPGPSRPSTYPDWCLTGTRTFPGSSPTNVGFVQNQRPPSEWHNFLFGYTGDWIRYLDYQVQNTLIPNTEFDASVGTGGSFPDINSLIGSPGIANIKKVLVTTPQTLTTTQVISVNDIEFVFKLSAVYSKGLSLAKGISITGQRVIIRGGRFTSFSGGSDVAIQIESGAKNCIVVDSFFAGNTTAVNDLGTNNKISIVEEI